MGMTYEELSYYGKLRKPMGCGPYSMVARLLHLWKDKHEPKEIARKVKHFYTSYAANRYINMITHQFPMVQISHKKLLFFNMKYLKKTF